MIQEIIDVAKSMPARQTHIVALKVAEETGELAQAVMKNHGYEEIVKEVADVIIAASDAGFQEALLKYGDTAHIDYPSDVRSAIYAKLDKWQAVYGNK
ncbi:MazG-like pyrophosphatase [Aeromonas phage BUCT695]|uniref:MazG-like pyrophosphatase n=1 Tax=Aeromonas phage BUCT695 TaxID=2908630 RepID=UPI0023291E40|nr:MazG-like pyrophosphatase [Aeromonas phage BUCT695]UIW10547.1 hypothetical protein [Aeromonas phage BUCT695]